MQQDSPEEIIIADDGSDERTKRVIALIRDQTTLSIKHVWHHDDGFRKCVILNRAIDEASGDYLVFSDGDCIPRSDFIGWHRQLAKPGHFLSGGYNKLPMGLSREISEKSIISGDAFRFPWLLRNGFIPNRQSLRLVTKGLIADLGNMTTTTRPTWNGHNASGWKNDLIQVNGFDERMRYGGEDCELGERLINLGIQPIQIRFHAICLHLDHSRGYVNATDLERNLRIRQATRAEALTRTKYGIRSLAKAA